MSMSVAGAARFREHAATRTITRAHALIDCVFLAAVTAISLVPRIGLLGFYYDDYPLLAKMEASGGSVLDRYHAVRPALGERSFAALLFAVLDWVFGPNALGWHVVNGLLIVAVAVLLYLILRELRSPRVVAVSLPLVYSTLPHYATERFWPDVIGVNLGNACYLLSLYAALRALRSRSVPLAGWLLLVATSFTVMVFTYEIFAPLVVVSLVLVAIAAATGRTRVSARRAALLPSAVLLATAIATAGARAAGVAENGQNGYELGFQNGFAHHLEYLVSGAVKVNFGTYFVALPYVLWWILRNEFDVTNVAVALATGLISFAYVLRLGRAQPANRRRSWRPLLILGAVTFVLGYAIFFATESILFRSAGLDNRTNVAAAYGVAAMLVGGAGWLADRLRSPHGAAVFAAVAASAVASGALVIETLGSFWTRAAQQQDAIVASVVHDVGGFPASSTVILDGSCPEIGPAVVFGSQWDFPGALQLAYGDPSLSGDVAYQRMRAGRRALIVESTPLDKIITHTYPYRRNLFVYDYSRRKLYDMSNRKSALRYVTRSRPSFHCPPLRSFAWGFDISKRFSLL
jgi:hypothetical protein